LIGNIKELGCVKLPAVNDVHLVVRTPLYSDDRSLAAAKAPVDSHHPVRAFFYAVIPLFPQLFAYERMPQLTQEYWQKVDPDAIQFCC
jgi:hypothetical protein